MARLLLVEDEPDLLDLLSLFLEDAGHEVLRAATGREGARLLREGHPDVVLLDLTLPDMDGWSVLDAVRSDPTAGAVPVLIVSANAFPHEEARARYQGVRAFLRKPYDPDRVVAEVERVLRARYAAGSVG